MAAALLDGCAGGDTTAETTVQPTSSGSASTSPSTIAASNTGVAPAAGKVIDTSLFTARVPKRFDVVVSGKDFSITALGPDAGVHFSMIDLNGRELSLTQLARDGGRSLPELRHAPLGRRTTLGGEPAYLLTASKPFDNVTAIGLERDGTLIRLEVDTYATRAAQHRLVGSILATWQWK